MPRPTDTGPMIRVSGPPNSNFLVGYPGINATLPRIEGKVEIRPTVGISAPVKITYVTIGLHRVEKINPSASKLLGSQPRREIREQVGREMQLFQCKNKSRSSEDILYMDLPFVLFIPFPRKGELYPTKIPPGSIQHESGTLETHYEILVSVQMGPTELLKRAFPVPLQRYDLISTFRMYDWPESQEKMSDHLVSLGIVLPRWSFGPHDPVSIQVRVTPNPDYMKRAKKVTIKHIVLGIEEEITFNPESETQTTRIKQLTTKKEPIGTKLMEEGFVTTLAMVFPNKDLRTPDGFINADKEGFGKFPMIWCTGFTTTATLYKIEYYVTVKAVFGGCKDCTIRQRIVVTPFDHQQCRDEMDAIEHAARDAARINDDNPMLPAPLIIRPSDPKGLNYLGFTYHENQRKVLIE